MFGLIKKFTTLWKAFVREQSGFTAIQTVIGAVALVGAAGSVAGGVVTSGTQAAEQSKQKIEQVIENIQGTFMLKGSVIGMANTTGAQGTLSQISFIVGLVIQGGAADLTPPTPSPDNSGLAGPESNNLIVISYTDDNQHVENLYWTVTKLGKDDGDNLLEGNELFQITIGGDIQPGRAGGNLVDALGIDLSPDSKFTIEMTTPQGAVLAFDRTTPSSFHRCVNLR